jgi:hypothetical protein
LIAPKFASVVKQKKIGTTSARLAVSLQEEGKTIVTNKMIWAVAFKNSICMICWTGLAIYFGKWWIALFALLSFTSVKWRDDDNA